MKSWILRRDSMFLFLFENCPDCFLFLFEMVHGPSRAKISPTGRAKRKRSNRNICLNKTLSLWHITWMKSKTNLSDWVRKTWWIRCSEFYFFWCGHTKARSHACIAHILRNAKMFCLTRALPPIASLIVWCVCWMPSTKARLSCHLFIWLED